MDIQPLPSNKKLSVITSQGPETLTGIYFQPTTQPARNYHKFVKPFNFMIMKTFKWTDRRTDFGWNARRLSFLKNSLLLLMAVFAFSSCEENMWLRSEKKLKSQIQGTWSRIPLQANAKKDETWTIRDGVIAIAETEKQNNGKDDGYKDMNTSDNLDTLVYDLGNYSVDAKLDNAYIRLSGLEEDVVESAKQGLSAKWTIVDIDNSILVLAAENGSAVIQREFEKK